MQMTDLIGKKRDGKRLSTAEIDFMVQALSRDVQSIPLLFHERMHHGYGGGLFIIRPDVHALYAQPLVNSQKLCL